MSNRELLPWVPGLKRPNFIFYRIKISFPRRIPNSVIFGLIYISLLYIYVGGVYDLVESPLARSADASGNPVLIMRDQSRQFLIEGIVAGIVMFMGAAGLYLIDQATADIHNPNRATAYQIFGVVLLGLSYILLQTMYKCKTTTQC